MLAEYHLENFGCRASQADGEAIAAQLRRRGLALAAGLAEAKVVVVNTCSVTEQADRTARAFLRRVRRENPSARIVVTGCYAQRAPAEVAALEGVDAVVGNSHKAMVAAIAEEAAARLSAASQLAEELGSLKGRGFQPCHHANETGPASAAEGVVSEENQPFSASRSAAPAKDFVPLASLAGPPASEMTVTGQRRRGQAAIWVDESFAHASIAAEAASPGIDMPRDFFARGDMPRAGAARGKNPRDSVVQEEIPHADAARREESSAHGRTRPVLKVQDGCGNRCSFCIIPFTRGPSRSLPLADCVRAAAGFRSSGDVELVLSGINLGRWGRDLTPQSTLEDLVRALLTVVPRLRLSSVEPMDWTPELLSLFPSKPSLSGLARHAHLPLQSGSDSILRAMHRRYRPWHYAEKLAAIRRRMPGAAIGADVMVGFPGEDDSLFEESFAFLEAQPLTYLHLFPFSPRPGTAAWEWAQKLPVSPHTVHSRMGRLRSLMEEKNLAFRKSFVGNDLPAITLKTPEKERRQGLTRALTDNFLEIFIEGGLPANRSLWVTVTAVRGGALVGREAA